MLDLGAVDNLGKETSTCLKMFEIEIDVSWVTVGGGVHYPD